jgi:integrase
MALWKRKNTWWADVTVNGERFRQSLRTSDWREANSREKELIARIQDGKIASASGKVYARLGFGVAADHYLTGREKRVSERTIQLETERLRPLRRYFGERRFNTISADAIAEYQQTRLESGVSGRTINIEVGIVRRMLKRAKRWAMVAEDVTMFPETSNIGQALTADQKEHLFEVAGRKTRWMVAYCAAVLAASTTCRGVELKSVKWQDVDLFKKLVKVDRSKNESGLRTIPLNRDATEALLELRRRAEAFGYAEPEHYVFPACQHGHIDPTRHQKSWRSAWRSLTDEAGLRGFRFHDLRHTAITELAEAGTPDAALMAIAGHLSRRMLEHYSHVRMKAKRQAVESLDSGLMERRPKKAAEGAEDKGRVA